MTLRRLIVMRHAKSSSPEGVLDHDRPLDELGRLQAPQTAKQLFELGWLPNLILCSDARRTHETFEFVAPILGNPESQISRQLYNADLDTMLALIESAPGSVETLMLIGHNPGAATVVERLSGEYIDMRPANAALLEFHNGSWKLARLIAPMP